ncbi:acyltransferase [Fibrobacter sp. UWEL]|uniref:acyltransferase family protein n=1 Tax=Fibrobacter sp. UWEL TaxID=1896209 RepID=UPI000913CB73|nr:acyltransferase [Fibrobacter sp. UWEL]SHK55291.1 Surface polysaccharide O-acyltransferase, integral membrane enzyme [Fibrobacter sp. UWEL]
MKIFALKAKDPAIELIRIIACLLVIFAHSQFAVVIGGQLSKGLLGVSTLVADDVPLFLLVTGFFFFNRVTSDQEIGKTFVYRAKSFLTSIYIPTIIYILISILYSRFASPVDGFVPKDWGYLGHFVFMLLPGDHLWYVCTYLSFVFFFPMFAFLCQDKPERNKMRRILLAVAIGGAVVADVQYFFRMVLLDVDKFLWGYCTIFLILGYELSLLMKKENLSKLKLGLAGLAMYLLSFSLKYGLQTYMFNQFGFVENRYRWLQTSLCFASAVGLFLVIYSLGSLIKKGGILAYVINFLGSCTFAIYLFHQLVISRTLQWRYEILAYFGNGSSELGCFAYYICYGGIVFLISLGIGFVFKMTLDTVLRSFPFRKK